MNEIIIAPLVYALLVLSGAIGDRLLCRLWRTWSNWREAQRRLANTVGDPADPAPSLAKETWSAPERLRMPGTTLPRRVPAATLAIDPPPPTTDWWAPEFRPAHARYDENGDYLPLHDADSVRTQLMPAIDTAELFAELTRANWRTAERAALTDWRCVHCAATPPDHSQCPGCECPCTLAEVNHG